MERPTLTPNIGDVLIAVEACGICGADALNVEGAGIATFNGLKKCSAEAGDLMATQENGELGHMAQAIGTTASGIEH